MTTDPAPLLHPDRGQPATTIHIVDLKGFDDWLAALPEKSRAAVTAQGLKAEGYANAIIPGEGAQDWAAVTVVANAADLSAWCLAKLAADLPGGTYRLAQGAPGKAGFGWIVAQHRFTRYKSKAETADPRILLTAEPARIDSLVAEARATLRVRDMVDTPAADMGPADMEGEAEALAKAHGATLHVTRGDALANGYPLIHAVGRAAPRDRAPRLIELVWGDAGDPRVAIVGKGVSFDTGGLDIKPAAGMALMKKDMGGAAHALALAGLVMDAALPVRLHLLIPAVENSISGDAMRPGDIVASRSGLTVEIDNTDAEGRLILADALSRAGEDEPELIVDFATLTGAARVALGPDLPALFANDDALAAAMLEGGTDRDDPLWRMPLWDGYDTMLKAESADITNSPAGGFAGSITAALFLRRFVPSGIDWAHIDTFAWRPSAKPGRPRGGAALGLRAAWAMLEGRFPRK